MRKQLLLLLFSLFSVVGFARTVTGVVTNASDNEPIIGATVMVHGTQRGTATDIDGKYSIEVKDNDVRRIGLDLFEAILAVIGHGGIKAAQEEPVLQRVHKLDFVIDKQDFNGFLRHNDSLE